MMMFSKDEQEKEIDNKEIDTSGKEVDINDYYPENEEELISGDPEQDTVVFAPEKKHKKGRTNKLSRGQKVTVGIMIALYALVILVAGWVLLYKPATSLPTDELPFDITEPEDIATDTDGDKHSTVVNKGYTEKGDSYNVLLVGQDRMAHLADVTMIVNVNAKENTVSVMQIPRDTYSAEEYITGKINALYTDLYNKELGNGSQNASLDALKDYAKHLEKSLCIKIHHVVLLNLNGFSNIVDAVGGVDVYVPNDMYYSDPAQDLYINIKAGMQHMDGSAAEGFVRFRYGYVQADLGRVNAQKIFLTAFFNKLKGLVKTLDVNSLNNLVGAVFDNVDTTMDISDMMYFAKLALKVKLSDITMLTIPGYTSGQYYVINRQATLNAVNSYFNVYKKEIKDSIFDKNLVFCDPNSAGMTNVYYGDPANVLDKEYNAESIDENSIYIPRN